MEPFRCLIDAKVRKALNLKQIKEDDFNIVKKEYLLKFEKYSDYATLFYQDLVDYKKEVFKFVQSYYRAFMKGRADLMDLFILE